MARSMGTVGAPLDLWELNDDRPSLGPAEDGPADEMALAASIRSRMLARGVAIPCLIRPGCPTCAALIGAAVDFWERGW